MSRLWTLVSCSIKYLFINIYFNELRVEEKKNWVNQKCIKNHWIQCGFLYHIPWMLNHDIYSLKPKSMCSYVNALIERLNETLILLQLPVTHQRYYSVNSMLNIQMQRNSRTFICFNLKKRIKLFFLFGFKYTRDALHRCST